MGITPMFLTPLDTRSILSMLFAGNHVGGLTYIVEDNLDFNGMKVMVARFAK